MPTPGNDASACSALVQSSKAPTRIELVYEALQASA